jgi:hypothetical protein
MYFPCFGMLEQKKNMATLPRSGLYGPIFILAVFLSKQKPPEVICQTCACAHKIPKRVVRIVLGDVRVKGIEI